jgi:replicative DNA helicase
MKNNISNLELEKSIIGTIIKNGSDSYYETADLIDSNCFYYPETQLIYNAVTNLIKNGVEKFDNSTVIHQIKEIDKNAVEKYEINDVISDSINLSVLPENISNISKSLLRLTLLRGLDQGIVAAREKLKNVDASATLLDITSTVEKVLFDFTSKIINGQNQIVDVSKNIHSFVEYLATNPQSIRGIPTGFPLFDKAIGGGLRRGGFHVIGGRAKSLKSTTGFNMANNVAQNGIPVLFLDTEMNESTCMSKLLAMNSNISIRDIESGNFAKSESTLKQVAEAERKIDGYNFSYVPVAGLSHHKIISIAKKWLLKNVGLDENGRFKDCLVILDYLKTMDLKEKGNDQEYQYLGQIATDLHNFATQYDVPVLTFVQLNRDGIDREDSGVVSGSDRILWLCTSLSIIKKKSDEDRMIDPDTNGDRKLIVVAARYGSGLREKEYINIFSEPEKGIVKEGKSNLDNIVSNGGSSNNGYKRKNSNIKDDDSFSSL